MPSIIFETTLFFNCLKKSAGMLFHSSQVRCQKLVVFSAFHDPNKSIPWAWPVVTLDKQIVTCAELKARHSLLKEVVMWHNTTNRKYNQGQNWIVINRQARVKPNRQSDQAEVSKGINKERKPKNQNRVKARVTKSDKERTLSMQMNGNTSQWASARGRYLSKWIN